MYLFMNNNKKTQNFQTTSLFSNSLMMKMQKYTWNKRTKFLHFSMYYNKCMIKMNISISICIFYQTIIMDFNKFATDQNRS